MITLPEVLIRLCLSSKIDPGWDESMEQKCMCDYQIRVGNEWYDAETMVCNTSAEEIESLATRVWTITGKNKNCVVVTDVWLDGNRKQEHTILEEFFATDDTGNLILSGLKFSENPQRTIVSEGSCRRDSDCERARF